ncbi:hypothetical protein HYN86_01305 [Flavobacterium fluviale]|uniref:Uncharacterized protein n=2 Tax=Flavobacterium fluviale TaxID=2249356 RepID=A0A344LN22_9FLAO|nr:hypothetical protein HYN86_01305 [Flavobacterium fluviale]
MLSSQIIKGEETYYIANQEKNYSTYHFVKSEYSIRSFQIFVVNMINFEKIKSSIPKTFSRRPKQDFTDIYVLGIENFDKTQLMENEKKIIENYIIEINKYRAFYNLSVIEDREFIEKNFLHYIDNEKDLCLYMLCPDKN